MSQGYTILLALFMVLMLLPVIYVTILLFTDRQLLWHQVTQCFRRLERLEKVAAETTWPQWSSLWPQTPRDKRKCASVAVAAGLSAVCLAVRPSDVQGCSIAAIKICLKENFPIACSLW